MHQEKNNRYKKKNVSNGNIGNSVNVKKINGDVKIDVNYQNFLNLYGDKKPFLHAFGEEPPDAFKSTFYTLALSKGLMCIVELFKKYTF